MGSTVMELMELMGWSVYFKGIAYHWIPTGFSTSCSLKRCKGCFINRFFDPVVETGAAEHQALPQKSTNWVLMRSTASVSEELLRFFYFQTPELLFFPSRPADTHISWSYRGGHAGLALLAFSSYNYSGLGGTSVGTWWDGKEWIELVLAG